MSHDLLSNPYFRRKENGMSAPPLVSIVLCTYNGEAFLAPQMETLLAQTYPHIEIVVSDDASTDGTYALLETYAAKDSRINLFRNDKNLGFNKNFEQALQRASGEWCAISDQDDLWEQDKIGKMMQHAAGHALVHCSSNQFQTGQGVSKKQKRHYRKFEGTDARKVFLYNTFEGHCLLIRKDVALRSIPFPDGIYYDWWLGLQAAVNGGVYWEKEVLTYHRLHGANASSRITQQEQQSKSRLRQVLRNITAFLAISQLSEGQKEWGETLKGHLEQHLAGHSKPLYRFMRRHRKLIFYYKKGKLFPLLSHLKAIRKFMKGK